MLKYLIFILFSSFLYSCSKSKDCECTTKGANSSSSITIYDYDGSCSEMNEDNVSCSEL